MINNPSYRGVILLLLIIIPIYSNTLEVNWHLDDFPNILMNDRLHLESLTFESVGNFLFPDGRIISRPISRLALALNWYFGEKNVSGYHVVNIMIHFFTAAFLFLTILNLLKTPNLKTRFKDQYYFIALLATVLWTVNPIQTQSVTYIVQRMTSLAAMFYILSIYLYLKGRFSEIRINRWLYFVLVCICFGLACGSKENAVTLPIAILLIEIIFFQDLNKLQTRRFIKRTGIALILLIAILISIFLFNIHRFGILDGYETRPFTLIERLMTEPRIVIFYISQIFYPIPNRLSIEHDVTISTSLFQPWTTLPAIIAIVALIAIASIKFRKWPLLSFAILFFFLNHLIESTIIPLELIFEHRNYLPTCFLFLPIAVGFSRLLDVYQIKKKFMHITLIGFMVFIIIGLGISTYNRNVVWATERTLWQDTVLKAPNSSRAYYNLAWDLSWYGDASDRDYDLSLKLLLKALDLDHPILDFPSMILSQIGDIYLENKKYTEAVKYLKAALEKNPASLNPRERLIELFLEQGKLEDALEQIDIGLNNNPDSSRYLDYKAIILLKKNNAAAALTLLQRSYSLNSKGKASLINLGVAYGRLGNYKRGRWYLELARDRYQTDPLILIYLIENSYMDGEFEAAERYAAKFIASMNYQKALKYLERLKDNKLPVAPIQYELVSTIIMKEINKIISSLIH